VISLSVNIKPGINFEALTKDKDKGPFFNFNTGSANAKVKSVEKNIKGILSNYLTGIFYIENQNLFFKG
jgi:hypothetical protein